MATNDQMIPGRDGWKFDIALQDGEQLPLVNNIVDTISAFHDKLGAVVAFSDGKWTIAEGQHNAGDDFRQGVSIHAQSKLGRTFDVTSNVNGDGRLMSLVEQTRSTMGDTSVFNVIRGFMEPGLTESETATLESKEEAGIGASMIKEIGYPYNVNPHVCASSIRGGVNSFSINIPPGLLEELPQMSQGERARVERKWKLKKGILEGDVDHSKVGEGIKQSLFLRLEEILRQRIWSGTAADLFTIISAARENLCRNPKLNYSEFWDNLPKANDRVQLRRNYPIKALQKENYGHLLGGKPGWKININNNSTPIKYLRAINENSNQEVVYGDRSEFEQFDGFVFAYPGALLMPVLEINGQAFVGGRFVSRTNVGESVFFSSICIHISLGDSYEDKLTTEFTAQAGVKSQFVFSDVKRSGYCMNPNSAHFAEGIYPVFARVLPGVVTKREDGNYAFKEGDPGFVFMPVEEVVNNTPDGLTAAAASVVVASARDIS